MAAYTKYLGQIDRLQEREFMFGYIQQVTPEKDLRLWNSLVGTPWDSLQELLPPRKNRTLSDRSHRKDQEILFKLMSNRWYC